MRPMILAASRNRWLRALARDHGLRFGAGRFVAGTTPDELVGCARALNVAGRRVSCAYLGEGVGDEASAARITADFVAIVERIAKERLDSSLAVKLTHLGLDTGVPVALRNAGTVVERAASHAIFVRIDMEEARYVDRTLEIYRALRARGLDNVGIVLQSCLRRSAADLNALLPLRPNVRIVKGAYVEPGGIAFREPARISKEYLNLVRSAFDAGSYVAVATHDRALIEATRELAGDRLEFQMLLGVRTALQDELVRGRLPLRISVPFGTDWYPYLMRRIAEKPSNLWMVMRNLR